MTVGGAILLGAVLAPTDPVLAGDLQIGPPLEGKEHPVRFALTTEAGLNDGLAFPFVYLALHVASQAANSGDWLAEWLAWDVVYRIACGSLLGIGIGWLLGRILAVPAWNTVAASGPGVLVLAGVFLAYGIVELAEGYGFIAAFVAGLVCRRAEARNRFHQHLHAFASSIEHSVTAILLVLLGSVMPSLWPHLDWRHAIIGFGLILVIRPFAGMIGLLGSSSLRIGERAVVAIYGVRGIGSLYYLGYASTHVEFIDEGQLWALVAFTIFASTVIHGLTATATVEMLDSNSAEGARSTPPSDREQPKLD